MSGTPPWTACRPLGSWPDGYGTYRWAGQLRRGAETRSCGHYHRKAARADECAAREARWLNKIAEQETGT
jgi:hypothetical protein